MTPPTPLAWYGPLCVRVMMSLWLALGNYFFWLCKPRVWFSWCMFLGIVATRGITRRTDWLLAVPNELRSLDDSIFLGGVPAADDARRSCSHILLGMLPPAGRTCSSASHGM